MKYWKPPLSPDPWYAHILRVLLRKNSRKRMNTMAKKKYKPEEDKWGWRPAFFISKKGNNENEDS